MVDERIRRKILFNEKNICIFSEGKIYVKNVHAYQFKFKPTIYPIRNYHLQNVSIPKKYNHLP